MLRLSALALSVALVASPSLARTPLAQDAYINDRLFAAAVGDQIRRNCGSISVRWTVVMGQLNKIKNHAEGLGYSRAEMDAYADSDVEKAKLKNRRDAYLKKAGVRVGNEASYCKLGRDEIAKGSLIGSLLKAR